MFQMKKKLHSDGKGSNKYCISMGLRLTKLLHKCLTEINVSFSLLIVPDKDNPHDLMKNLFSSACGEC